ncbi:MAG: peptidoglycan-binding protein [Gammaproteobacteria bacterium]|nr:peptidoglycan-binding protein [Gammaproteobacteria bacterium]
MNIKNFNKYHSAFDVAFNWIMLAEGGYSNDATDRGGETLYGLSRRSYPNLDFNTLTLAKAKMIYHRDFWRACHAEQLPSIIAIALFDAAVNHGVRGAVEILQRAAGAKPDGIIGNKTIGRILDSNHSDLLALFLARRCRRYARIVVNDPSQNRFLLGWMNRITKLQMHLHQVAVRYNLSDWSARVLVGDSA